MEALLSFAISPNKYKIFNKDLKLEFEVVDVLVVVQYKVGVIKLSRPL